MSTKRCPLCGCDKDVSLFYPASKRPDGLTAWCKECSKKKSKEFRTQHPDKVREYNKSYKQTEAYRKERKLKRPKYKEAERAGNLKWLAAHPAKASYIRRKAAAKWRRGQQLVWEISEEWYVLNIWDKKCAYGDHPANGGIDRVDNSIGYTPDNCVPCCWWCNSVKREHTLDDMYGHLDDMLEHRYQRPNPNQTHFPWF